MVEIVYLKKGERRLRGDKALLIKCKPGLRQEIIEQSPAGATWTIRTADLDNYIAQIKQKGAKRVYVRMYGDA